ncbi:MAG: 4-hydroxy-tetrahydrodipicolinate synthase [Clostridia bacterium]|nr:4-hydroxy-tetrahydrodipicolinate synthase [Clostridia bacterium]
MKKTLFTGAGVAIVTPFNADGTVNYDRFKELIDRQIENSTDAIIVAGTTGEAATLSTEEHIEVIKRGVEFVDKRVPVIAGCGSNDTKYNVELASECKKAGSDALLMVTPYYNKTSQKGLIEHFTYIADRVEAPIILYNVPSRTGVNIEPETYSILCKHDNIIATKEANGDISALAKTISLCGDNLDVYSGNDDQIASFVAMGAKGVISVLSNVVPKVTHDIAQLGVDGDVKKSVELQLKYLKLCNDLFMDVNPIPVKEALNMMGLDVGGYRLPLCEMTDSNKAKLEETLKLYNLI